jgi:CubicO group peptidase (beta-lactamase class C family)
MGASMRRQRHPRGAIVLLRYSLIICAIPPSAVSPAASRLIDWLQTRAVLEAGRADGLHRGAQVAVWHQGTLHEWAVGEAQPGVIMTPDSVNLWLSSGKPLTVVALARQVAAGRLHWDDAVTDWIPEFAGGGKESITVRHLLTHTGGFRTADTTPLTQSWEETLAHVCATPIEPGWVVGETAGYHSNSSWFILGEILSRMLGRSFREVIRDEVTAPLGLGDGWFGMDAETVAELAERWSPMCRSGRGGIVPDAILNEPVAVSRSRPGSGLRAPARFLARFYHSLLEPPPGLLPATVLADLIRPQRVGVHDRTFLAVVDFGLGFLLNSDRLGSRPAPYGYGPHAGGRTFGHSGNQSSCGFADPDAGLAAAWVCNGMPGEPLHQRRQREIQDALYRDLGLGDRTKV